MGYTGAVRERLERLRLHACCRRCASRGCLHNVAASCDLHPKAATRRTQQLKSFLHENFRQITSPRALPCHYVRGLLGPETAVLSC